MARCARLYLDADRVHVGRAAGPGSFVARSTVAGTSQAARHSRRIRTWCAGEFLVQASRPNGVVIMLQ